MSSDARSVAVTQVHDSRRVVLSQHGALPHLDTRRHWTREDPGIDYRGAFRESQSRPLAVAGSRQRIGVGRSGIRRCNIFSVTPAHNNLQVAIGVTTTLKTLLRMSAVHIRVLRLCT